VTGTVDTGRREPSKTKQNGINSRGGRCFPLRRECHKIALLLESMCETQADIVISLSHM
jgi:hypothetical protein